MSTQNEDNNVQHPLPGISADYPAFDLEEPSLAEASWARAAAEVPQSENIKRRLIDAAQKGLTETDKVARTVVGKERKQAQMKKQALTEGHAKPARTKRAKVQSADNVKDQAETMRPQRTSITKRAKAAVASSQTTPAANDMPSVTPDKVKFEKQAPDLVDSAAQAHKAMEADWVLAYEVSSTLSYVTEVSEPLSKDAVAALVKKTIETIQAIKGDQQRQEALSFSYQIGLWQPLYKEEFARQAPELVALAQAASKAEEAKTKRAERNAQGVENLLEQSPMQLVTDAQQTSPAKRAANSKRTATADQEAATERLAAEQRSVASAASSEKNVSFPVSRLNLGRRLLLAIGGAVQRAGMWLQEQGTEGQALKLDVLVALEKPPTLTGPAVLGAPLDDNSTVVPEAVARRFLKVEHEYYFQDRTPAFSDFGNRLATRGTNLEVVRSLVEIAKARGWDTITVKGTEEFRRSAWMEAAKNGLTVAGYKPSALDVADLASRPANNTVENSSTKERSTTRVQPAAQSPVAQSASVPTPAAASKTPAPGSQKTDLELAEKARAFQENKPAFVVKKYPDLAAAYGIIAAARAFAADKLSESARDEFIEMARRHVIRKIAADEQIKGLKIYVAPTRTTEVGDPSGTGLTTADLGKSAGAKAVERGR